MQILRKDTLLRISYSWLFLSLVFISCSDDPPPTPPPPEVKFNYVVLLDLSDRILQNGQIESDTNIISGLYDLFLEKLRNELYINTKDEFKILIADQNGQFPNNKIYDIEDELYINMEDVPISEKVKIRESKSSYLKKVGELYAEARFSEKPNDYKGANILGYLKNDFTNDRISGENTRNFLFILTDGYQYVANRKYNTIDDWDKVTDLSGVSVAVVELNPSGKEDDNELNRIKNAWENWLTKMNVANILLLNKQGNTRVKKKLIDFLSKKKAQTEKRNSNLNDNESVGEFVNTNFKKTIKNQKIKKKDNSNKHESIPPKKSLKKQEDNFTIKNEFPKIISQLPAKIFYADFDADGLGDPNESISSEQAPPNYTIHAGDNCPTRKGEKMADGCPKLSITPLINEIYIDKAITFSLDYLAVKGDLYNWKCLKCNEKELSTHSPKQSLTFSELGRESLSIIVSNNSDNYRASITRNFNVKISRKLIKEYLDDIIGLSDKNTLSKILVKESEKKLALLKSLASNSCTIVHGENEHPIIDDGALSSFLMMAQLPNIKDKITLLSPENFYVARIKYDEVSGKIRQIQLSRKN